MKKTLLIITLALGFMSMTLIDETPTRIIPGIGIEGYVTVNATTSGAVKTKFGTDYKEVNHYITTGGSKSLYSVEHLYKKQGVSFYFRPNKDTVFAIHFFPAYKGKTDKNIVCGVSTMQDVINAYGNVEWAYTDNEMSLDYSGIAFIIPFSGKFPVPESVQTAALTKKVAEIAVRGFEQ